MTSEWRPAPFGDVATLIRDTVAPSGTDSDTPYIGLEHIEPRGLRMLGVGKAADVTSAKSRFQAGDILFGKLRPYFRKVVRPDFDGICSTDIWVVRPTDGVDPGFLFHAMADARFADFAMSGATGTRMPRANWRHVCRLEVHLPPLREQQAISEILGALDTGIEAAYRRISILGTIATELYRDTFVDREASNVAKQGIVSDLCDVIENGGTPKRMTGRYWSTDGPGIDWYKTGELSDLPLIRSEERITDAGLAESSCKLWPNETVLIALYASPTVGRLGMLTAPATANQACTALQARDHFGPDYLFHVLLHARGILQAIAVGSAQQNISQRVVAEHPIPIPYDAALTRFRTVVEPARKLQASDLHRAEALHGLRQELIPKLISGELRIPDAEELVEEAV